MIWLWIGLSVLYAAGLAGVILAIRNDRETWRWWETALAATLWPLAVIAVLIGALTEARRS